MEEAGRYGVSLAWSEGQKWALGWGPIQCFHPPSMWGTLGRPRGKKDYFYFRLDLVTCAPTVPLKRAHLALVFLRAGHRLCRRVPLPRLRCSHAVRHRQLTAAGTQVPVLALPRGS